MKLQFNKLYFISFIILFCIEVLIAVFLKDGFIRHTFGDFLVVILLYCFFSSFIKVKTISMAIFVLLISYVIETLQYFNLLELLHLQNSTLAKLVLGSTFHTSDLIAYTLGIFTVLIIEHQRKTL